MEDLFEGGVHAVAGTAVLAALAVKVSVVRRGGERIGRMLPVIGLTVFALFMLTWATSAGKLGPTSIAEIEAQEERIEAREDARDDRLDAREDRQRD